MTLGIRPKPKSLSGRLLLITSVWTVGALILTGLIISNIYRVNAERSFDDLLLAHAYNVMAAIDATDQGVLSGQPNLGDPLFLAPQSGWYWTVSKASSANIPILHSASIPGDEIVVPETNEIPFGPEFRRFYNFDGGRRVEAQLFLGEGETLFQVIVAGNLQDLSADISYFQRLLFSFFALFAVGSLLATYFVIRVGLRPLAAAKAELNDVREGNSEKVSGNYPSEIDPLIEEINALIGVNRTVIDRARTQVGNLAHALKTPLAVIQNEIGSKPAGKNKVIAEQTQSMRSHVQSYLDRARIASNTATVRSRTDVKDITDRLVRVFSKLSPDIGINDDIPKNAIFFGEEQDLEEVLGNLIENAVRFARDQIRISCSASGTIGGRSGITIVVEDNGPGVSEDEMELITRRGVRLDETNPGSGLGLNIVSEIAGEYGGQLEISDSTLGGLSAKLTLPGSVSRV